tara:strand:+ start:392 stop:571 length:180 start_codon:yes stop_codon:yes gene_type:complete
MNKEDVSIMTDLIEDAKIKKGSQALISILLDLIDKNGDGKISQEELSSCFCPCLPKKKS